MVTLSGSPPKAEMYLLIQRRAVRSELGVRAQLFLLPEEYALGLTIVQSEISDAGLLDLLAT